ncbi:hypothetical protein TeGR_g15235 [Tetraparma gracilis]|uniref:Uncharacterized protein n=1 Tax=Tetraparma gracilis TaxID=2962635 RepID=A0ABQ6NBE0_9STRA|nr:hypothetical protein TeGR_g15235 [Tetraparma gracilis]
MVDKQARVFITHPIPHYLAHFPLWRFHATFWQAREHQPRVAPQHFLSLQRTKHTSHSPCLSEFGEGPGQLLSTLPGASGPAGFTLLGQMAMTCDDPAVYPRAKAMARAA